MLPALTTGQVIKFTDVTAVMKVPGWVTNGFSTYGHGAIWTDISGDSLPDLYIANAMRQANSKLPETLYISHAGAPYTEEDGSRGVSDSYGSTGSHGVILADYDNDGDLDLFNATTDDRIRLYRNKGNGFFENFTSGATLASTRVTYEGYGTIGYGTRGLVVFDADNDGDMDLYGTNWGPVEDIHEVPWITPAQPNEFFINNGNGTFSNVTDRGCTPVNPSNEGTQGVTAIDIDEDGDMDIFVCHRNYAFLGYNSDGTANFGRGATPAPNDLFINDGKGNFTEADVRARGLWSEANDCNATTFADYDNDGDLDAFVVYANDSRPVVRVLKNDGKGYFTNVSASLNIEQWGFTPFLFDMDNDGDLDLYSPRTRERGRIYRNNGDGTFTLQSGTGVEISMYDPRGGSIADLDGDGDLDIYITDANKDAGPYFNRMFRNDTPSNNRWLKVWGSGPKGDLGAFGTKIWLFEKGYMDDMTRLVGYKQIINAYGYLSQDDIVQHFGVAQRDSVDIRIKMLDGTILKTR
ncbi:MAG TPA: VCBS repeat-containing protein, partial [bacterium]|nr:VCBS repeat-containing protein [bacterium]